MAPDDAKTGQEVEAGKSIWPFLIAAGLILVVVVNALFIYIAVSGADDVVPSYATEER